MPLMFWQTLKRVIDTIASSTLGNDDGGEGSIEFALFKAKAYCGQITLDP